MTTPLEIFKSYITFDSNGKINASAVLSEECYSDWLATRFNIPNDPEEMFRKTLVAHVRAGCGRKPFEPAEEAAVLAEIRQKRTWPCFLKDRKVKIGMHGFRGTGFHESGVAKRPSKTRRLKRLIKNENSHKMTSYDLLIYYAKQLDAAGNSMILSSECYEAWKENKGNGPRIPEFAFRQTLTGHLKARDGRKPFPAHIEAIILKEVRQKKSWPCFKNHPDKKISWIGRRGFSGIGYHEQTTMKEINKRTSIIKQEIIAEKMIPLSRSASFLSLFSGPSEFKLDVGCIDANLMQGPFKRRRLMDPSLDELVLPDPEAWFSENLTTFDCSTGASLLDNFTLESYRGAMETPSSNETILSTFEDVTPEEVTLVVRLRDLTAEIFENHFAKVKEMYGIVLERANCPDICGDIKLLRTLRACNGDITEAVSLIKKTLDWRLDNNIEIIRSNLLSTNYTLAQWKLSWTIGRYGGVHPFFAQEENGDIVDLWRIPKQTLVDGALVARYVVDYHYIYEFRSLALDKLSRSKRRVVKFSLILDWSLFANAEESARKGSTKSFQDWIGALQNRKGFILEITDMLTKWHGGMCKKLYIINCLNFSLLVVQALSKSYLNRIFTSFNLEVQQTNATDVLQKTIGNKEKWPSYYGGRCESELGSGPALVELSRFGRKDM